MRFVACRLLPEQLPGLVRSAVKHCNEGGCIVWTEMELPVSNDSDFERYTALIIQALKASGRAFSPGSALGITSLIGPLLYDAGYDEIQHYATAINLSYRPYLRFEFIEQMFAIGHALKPFMLASGITTEEAYDELLESAMIAVSADSFCAQCWLSQYLAGCREMA